MTAGRIAAYNQDRTGRDWGVPVLYLRAADGNLFEGAADTTAREHARASAEADVNVRIGNVQGGGVVTGAKLLEMLAGHLAVNVTVSGTVLGKVVGATVKQLKGGGVKVTADVDTVEGEFIGLEVDGFG